MTHLGYYDTEYEAARVHDRVAIVLYGDKAETNFPKESYSPKDLELDVTDRQRLQETLGVHPMNKSSR